MEAEIGIGDNIIATGLARASGENLVAFGDGKRIRWDHNSEIIFRGNSRIAHPGQEGSGVHWIPFYKGNRLYNKSGNGRWIWNYDFRVKPGQLYFDKAEMVYPPDDSLVLIEPNVPNKPCAPNKQWPLSRWSTLASKLSLAGFKVRQFDYGGPNRVAEPIRTPTFRHAAALLKRARFAVLPEGGLHHAAAAVNTPAVVLFGGFTPPQVLGYDTHTNLNGGAEACGTFNRCPHCIAAMAAIQVEQVLEAIDGLLLDDAEMRDKFTARCNGI